MKQTEFFGYGSIKNLENILTSNKIENVFLVTGKTSYTSSGAEKIMENLLEPYNVTRFHDFDENPKLEEINKGIILFGKREYDVVIAVGGGSVMDMAKSIRILSAQNGDPIDYVTKKEEMKSKGKPLIAIPTTSGTGSEATHFAVVYIGKKKYSLAHENILPEYSIVDPQFTATLPPKITASTGMDALSQAIESYWNVNSTKESDFYAEKAIKLIIGNLVKVVNSPSKSSRLSMAKAANLAGKAINITKTTAPHAISYPITSYFGIPHGHAVGLTLGKVLEYNSEVKKEDVLDKRGINYVKEKINKLCNFLDSENSSSAKEKLKRLMQNIGLKTSLSDVGIKTNEDLELILKNVNTERLINNPRQFTKEKLRNLLKAIK